MDRDRSSELVPPLQGSPRTVALGSIGLVMQSNFRNLAIWVVIALLLVALFNLFQNPSQRGRGNEINYTEFISLVNKGSVSEVTIAGNRIYGKYSEGGAFSTFKPEDAGLVDRLLTKDVKVDPVREAVRDGLTNNDADKDVQDARASMINDMKAGGLKAA